MQNALNPSWWHQPPKMQPLEAVRVAADYLERGDAVPPPAATIVARALRQYLAGQTDISRNLGLRPRRGGTHETPLRLEQATRRNEAIRAICDAMPATSKTGRAEQTAKLLRTPPDSRVTEAEVFGYVMRLHEEFGGTLPKSMRQVLRVVEGDTIEGRKT